MVTIFSNFSTGQNKIASLLNNTSFSLGMIDRRCNVCNLVRSAFEEAAILCEKTYTVSPELHLKIHNSVDKARRGKEFSSPIFITYPPRQIQFILVELFKNAMRATVETKGIIKTPAIEVLVAKGETDISIKISDQVIILSLLYGFYHKHFINTTRKKTPNNSPWVFQ